MTIRNYLWRLIPHRCKFGRAHDKPYEPGNLLSNLLRVKTCKLCAATKPVRASRKGVA